MRLLDYLGTAIRDIVTQPLRCLLTVSAITLSSALLVTLVTLGVTTRGAIINHVTRGNSLSTVVVSTNNVVGSGLFSARVQEERENAEKLTDDVVGQLATIPHVVSATPQVSMWELRSLQLEGTSTSYLATAMATSRDALRQNTLAAGEWFDNDDTAPRVVLGDAYLRALGISDPESVIGDQLTFTTVAGYRGVGAEIPAWNADADTRRAFDKTKTTLTATVVGVTAPTTSDNRVYLPMGWGRLVSSPRTATPDGETTVDSMARNGYTNIVLATDSKDSVASVANAVTQLGFGVITYEAQIKQINQLSQVMWMILGSVALISLISASLGIVNTLLMSVSEQKHTIRIWRASGASRGLISRLYILEAIILSLIGAAIGAAIGAIAYRLIADRIEAVMSGQGFGLLQLADVPTWILGGSVLVSVVLAMLAALYPAHVAARKIGAA